MATCTAGTDCYCDCAKHTTGLYKNAACQAKGIVGDATALLLCEDFEAPTLYDDTGFGNGAPFYGPWYDQSGGGFDCFRGFNSYWKQVYGNGGSNLIWAEGTPASPTKGCTCDTNSAGPCNNGAWHPTDLWQANSFAGISILKNGDFDDEVSSLGSGPSGTSDGGNGVFDGAQSFAHRIQDGKTQGILGGKNWSAKTTWGITLAIAYAANVDSSGIYNAQWKPDEWPAGGTDQGLLMGYVGIAAAARKPFEQNQVYGGGINESTCNSRISAATKTVGTMSCDSVAMRWFSDTSYTRDTHWPIGTWGCVRAYFKNVNSTTAELKIWLTTEDTVTEKTIVDITNLNLTSTQLASGITGYVWNAYANANQGMGETPSTETTFRYLDNVHIRSDEPVSCDQIGWAAGGGSPNYGWRGLNTNYIL